MEKLMEMNIASFTDEEKKHLPFIINLFENNFNRITERIQNSLQSLIFENINILEPSCFKTLIRNQIDSFLAFLKLKNLHSISLKGKESAGQGVSAAIVFPIFCAVKKNLQEIVPWENREALLFGMNAIDVYIETYVGFIDKEQCSRIYREQEQLYEALYETILKQREEIVGKERQLQQSQLDVLKAAKDRIEEQNNQRTNFLISFAHETKMPLVMIQNMIRTVKEEAAKMNIPTLPLLEEEINRMLETIINILDQEKIILGKILYNHDSIVDISKTLKTKIEMFRKIITENNIRMTSEIEDDLYIQIHPQALDRIMNNVIDNGIKYNKENGCIHLQLKGENDSVLFLISDTGIGMTMDQLNHCFEPYYQSDNRKKCQGIGAGLSIVKNIVNGVLGEIDISSRENEGTTVAITFKRHKICENKSGVVEGNIILTPPMQRHKIVLKTEKYDINKKIILVVEDDLELLSYIQDNLCMKFNFYYGENGVDALRKLKIIPKPDIIISDIMMDKMDGYEFYNTISHDERLMDIPFLFLTARTSQKEKLESLKIGVIDFINKPFSIEEVVTKIDAIVRNREIAKEAEIKSIEKKISSVLRTKGDMEFLAFEKKCKKFKLTVREGEVVSHLLDGLLEKEIAEKLFLSVFTVRKHVRQIYEKCGVQNRVELYMAFRE